MNHAKTADQDDKDIASKRGDKGIDRSCHRMDAKGYDQKGEACETHHKETDVHCTEMSGDQSGEHVVPGQCDASENKQDDSGGLRPFAATIHGIDEHNATRR